jgi:hypothetical protein
MKAIKSFNLLILISAIVVGCAGRMPPAAMQGAQGLTDEQVIESVLRRNEAVRSLRGQVTVRATTIRGSFKINQVLLVKKPDSFRMETLGFLGRVEAVFTGAGGRLSAYFPPEDKFYTGALTENNIELFIPMSMSATEMVSVLLGSVPIQKYSKASVSRDGGGELMVEFSQDGKWVTRVHVGADDMIMRRSETLVSGEDVILYVDFSGHEEKAGVMFPMEIAFQLPKQFVEGKVSVDDAEINAEIGGAASSCASRRVPRKWTWIRSDATASLPERSRR